MQPILYKKLLEYRNKDVYPFHMPGHKRNLKNGLVNPYELDITEITDFDNLNDPKGILRESMEQASKFYGTKKTFYLVNGSTSGLLAAITAVCHLGDTVLMARNCHKAVYNAVRILGLIPVYLPLKEVENKNIYGGIDEEALRKILKNNDKIKAVLITSPTYEGIVMHIESIKLCITPYKIPLIVDEAHGAHFPYLEQFPKSAIECGADIVIQSIHKTMPSFTQTALLHLCTDLIDAEKIQDCISIYQSSSPSYLLMMGIEYAISFGINNRQRFENYFEMLWKYREKFEEFQHIHLLKYEDVKETGAFDFDPCKLVFFFEDTEKTGEEISQWILEQDDIEFEMSERDYIIAISTVMDREEGFERLYQAMRAVDQEIEKEQRKELKEETEEKGQRKVFKEVKKEFKKNQKLLVGSHKMHYKPADALQKELEWIKLENAQGKICGDYIYIYPPGVPLLVPGEEIKSEDVLLIQNYLQVGFYVKGIRSIERENQIKILKNKHN